MEKGKSSSLEKNFYNFQRIGIGLLTQLLRRDFPIGEATLLTFAREILCFQRERTVLLSELKT